ncbi:hypothetical protein PMAYCL1PPCAC_04879, partial [Pristionchus mayeri]
VIQAFFLMSMIASLGLMIIARQQLLIPDGALLTMKTPVKIRSSILEFKVAHSLAEESKSRKVNHER